MKKTFQLIAFILVCGSSAFQVSAQEHTEEIQQLLAERLTLSTQNQNFTEVEKSIVNLGQLPPALVYYTQTSENKTFTFTTYKNIRPESEDRIEGRIMVSINNVQSIDINNRNIVIVFNNTATAADINDFFKLMGYNSYEIK